MEIANIVFRLLAASQIALFFGMLVVSNNPVRVRVVGCLLMVGILCYLVAPLCVGLAPTSMLPLLWFPASIAPTLLLLFVWLLCEEDTVIPVWLTAVIIASISVTIAYFVRSNSPTFSVLFQLSKIGVVGIAVGVLWRGRESDLVEQRIKLRNLLVLVISITVLCVVLVELLTGFKVPVSVEATGMAVICLSAFFSNLYFIHINPTVNLVGVPVPQADQVEDEMINTLLKRMTEERLYADHDLRVAGLADILGVPEYQLRKRINQKLGYRNFNQFVNRYRIQEAGVRLIEERKIPVLSIALDVGFRSISSFNTAFQAQFGVSPTRFRAEYQKNKDASEPELAH